jgi:hypothetical protein
LPGLNEINAGLFDGIPYISPAGLLYLIGPIAWLLDVPIMPMLAPGTTDFNGIVFERGYTGALQTMYNAALANPVLAASGKITDVAYSSQFTIEVATLMTVNNPNFLLMTHQLGNTGYVVIEGNPRDGWTMTNWDGTPVGPANLPTKLFVDVRDVIEAPEFAAFDIGRSLFTGNPLTIGNVILDGVNRVGNAVVDFPFDVTRDVVSALR